ncbi:MAG: response regulator transcription factor [Gemmatimonadota bacterium]
MLSGSPLRYGLISPEAAALVHVEEVGRAFQPRQSLPALRLTPREAEVAALLADGLRNRQIAQRLTLSVHTVRRHTERVLQKLGVPSRAGVARALSGELSTEPP